MWPVKLRFALKLLICFISFSLLLLVYAEDAPSFSYIIGAPNGPDNWGNNPNWTLCGTGRSQSPVNIFGLTAVDTPSLGTLDRQYKAAPALLKKRVHDIEVEWTGDAGEIILSGNPFKLVQCHTHIPAEHTIYGIRFALELHMVHVDSGGAIAVVAILYALGLPDPFIQTKILPYLQAANEEGVDLGFVNPLDIKYSGKKYYRYNGSLTTPPCSEKVTWTVIKTVRTASIQQINAIRAAVDEENTGNARPLQPLNGRTIYSYTEPFEF
nr:alpha carbonic anhydrase 1 [Hygrophila difformis]